MNQIMNKLSLFSGIGGLDLAAKWAGFKTVAFCEQNEFCQKVLGKHWPTVPVISDIREVTKERLINEGVDVSTIKLVSGGFPCQPFSLAGKRKGTDDNRYLWPETFRVVQEFQPDWFVGENVAGIVNMALETVCLDLEGEGYEVQPFLIPACGVEAPHKRERVFIVAHSNDKRLQGWQVHAQCSSERLAWQGSMGHSASERLSDWSGGTLGQPCPLTEFERPSGREIERFVCRVPYGLPVGLDGFGGVDDFKGGIKKSCTESRFTDEQILRVLRFYNSPTAPPQGYSKAFGHSNSLSEVSYEGRPTARKMEFGEQEIQRVLGVRSNLLSLEASREVVQEAGVSTDVWQIVGTKKVEKRVDRLKALGNAVVPQQAYPIFAAIAAIEQDTLEQELKAAA